MTGSRRPNTVFISYARETPEHTAWVRQLADALEEMPELDVVFDEYELHAGRDLTEFMDRGLACSRIVIVITPEYVRRAEKRLGGVGYESSVISADLVTNQLSDRCVPVLRDGDERPSFLKSKIYVDFRSRGFGQALDDLRQALLRVAPASRPTKLYSTHEGGPSRKATAADSEILRATLPNPAYTLESFLVSADSDVAFAACTAIAERMAHTYNPLFLYGPIGCGKTHLLQAVGTRLRDVMPDLNVIRLRSRDFTNNFIASIRNDRVSAFRDALRHVDALLLDDVDMFAGKERTQEELFHLFNTLTAREARIVVTGNSPPRKIDRLENRICAQLEGGLIAQVGYPDQPGLLQIARNATISKGIRLPEELLALITERTSGGPRDVQTIISVMATYRGQEPNASVEHILEKLLPRKVAPGCVAIASTVAAHYGLKYEEFITPASQDTLPRGVASYLMRHEATSSTAAIAAFFGTRLGEVSAHIKQVSALMRADEPFRDLVDRLAMSVHG